ncbi:hypothetical protein GCM10022408_34120 [Hymenobacter fastidiosus]|uniref:Uncharacterized protein n=1 Tax=Hymenobacter fastidiosus TaxID=486264 RepID=A0ABP7SWR4_9BACT
MVRPVTYADYRNRILTISPTLDRPGPMLQGACLYFATATQMWHGAERQDEADSSAYLLDLLGQEPLPAPAPVVVEPLAVPPAIEEPFAGVEEFTIDPFAQDLLLPPTITVREAVELLQALFTPGTSPVGEERDMTLTEFSHRKRARRMALAALRAQYTKALPAPISPLPTYE